MKLGVPWTVKGIRPETRETAKEAARRSGMPLGDWLNSVILHSADQAGGEPPAPEDDDDVYGDNGLNEVHGRLDDITRRLDKLGRRPASGPEAYAPPHHRSEPDQLAALIERLDKRIEQLANVSRVAVAPIPYFAPPPSMQAAMQPAMQAFVPPPPPAPPPPRPRNFTASLDQAVAEISARRRALSGEKAVREPAPQAAFAPAAAAAPATPAAAPQPLSSFAPPLAPVLPAPVPAQDISGLEDQLRKITTQIETLRHPGVEEAISALRGELAEIGNSLSEAMPRQAIDTIEQQIQGLSQRIAEGRHAGVDGDALVGIERGLAEVRDALGSLTPAESLIGFQEAVAGLAHKIDLIVGEKDPQTLHQLEGAITTLRDISQHIASNETVGRLASDVEMLADKIDRIANASAAGDALGNLEQRISALADAVSARSENGTAVPPRLEALVESLAGKLEQVQLSRGDNVAVGHLENRIVQLVEKLDASDSRLGNLEAVERGLADLLVHVEDMRAKKGEGGLRGVQNAGVDDLKQDIARTQDEIEAVHGTLGHVVERLAMIEQGIRGDAGPSRRAPATAAMPGPLAARVVDEPMLELTEADEVEPHHLPPSPQLETADVSPPLMPPRLQTLAAPPLAPSQAPPQQPQVAWRPAVKNPPIDPDLPPDQPIEPGFGHARLRANPGARIAASEAALAGADLPRPEEPAKSGFIAAARRAAQKAIADLPSRARDAAPGRFELDAADEASPPSLRTRIKQRFKSVFISASVIAIVVGGVQMGSQYFRVAETGAPGGRPVQTAQRERAAIQAGIGQPDASKPEIPGAVSQSSINVLPGMLPPSSTFGISRAPDTSRTDLELPQNALNSVPELTGKTPNGVASDVTGSVRHSAGRSAPAPHADSIADTGVRLPIAIGGPLLRDAATRGDRGAAYEIAVRYADGRGVPANLEESAHWLERAASEGLVPAQFRLGSLYEKGQGVKKDLNKARQLYAQAAGKGNAKAMHNLAVLYAEGIGGKPDYAAAAQWFRKAANHGISDSQYNLGILCARGLGAEKNFGESYKWFALAAAQGDKEAARKRDELTSRLDAKALAAAQKAITSWTAEPQPESATAIPSPPQGWDPATSELPAGKPKQRSRGSFEIGRR